MKVSDLNVIGRATQGVRLINLEKRNDEIASVCKVMSDPDEIADTDEADTTEKENASELLNQGELFENESFEDTDTPEQFEEQ